ncbi:MAG: DUF7487 domain-containing protein [Nitrosopumilaceae archaeon]
MKINDFITKAVLKHGTAYNYHDLIYTNAHTKITIACPIHGNFLQTPSGHLCGYGCPMCGKINRILKKTNTLEKFTKKANQVHNSFYNYNTTVYVNNHTKVEITCPIHGNFFQTPIAHFDGRGCSECGKLKRKQTNEKKYGVKCPLQSETINKKTKQTCLKIYGVEHSSQSKEIQEKRKQTWLEKYGIVSAFQSKEIQEKWKRTRLEKYGVTNPSQKHLTKYCLQKINDPVWLKEQHHVQKKRLVQIAFELKIGSAALGTYFKKYNIEVKPYSFSYEGIRQLEFIMKKENVFIQHALNIGEYRIPGTRLHVDGYCRETNTIYEFYGDYYHGNPNIFESDYMTFMYKTADELYQKTIKRENRIKTLGYNLVAIWETT